MHDGDNHHKRCQMAVIGAARGAVTAFGSQKGKVGWVNETLTFEHATPQVVTLPSDGPGNALEKVASVAGFPDLPLDWPAAAEIRLNLSSPGLNRPPHHLPEKLTARIDGCAGRSPHMTSGEHPIRMFRRARPNRPRYCG
jgi:hypothetical protein